MTTGHFFPTGWRASATVVPSGGNPDGYVRAENIGQAGIVTSAAPWIGDWPDDIRELVVDVQAFGTGDGVTGPYFRMRLDAFTNGWIYQVGSQIPIDGQWHQISLPLNPLWSDLEAEAHGWTLIPGTGEFSWAEVMAGLSYMIFAVEGVAAEEWVGFDNIGRGCGLFADGFESVNTDAWSSTMP